MERIMAIYDVDPFFADRFADYVNQKEKIPFTAVAFTSSARLREYAKDHTIEILLVDSNVKKQVEDIPAGQTISLCDGEVVEQGMDGPGVYKYQSGDSIVREVMARYCERPKEAALALLGAKAAVIGIYSPVNRCLKTSLALTMGQLMSREQRVLYINLEEFSGFSRLAPEPSREDLSDMLYLCRQGSYNWMRLQSMVYTWGGLDYVPPIRYPEDLEQTSAQELAMLVSRIAIESEYDAVLVDVGQMGRNAVPLLEICSVVYMPVKDDGISLAKVEEFDEYLMKCGKEELKGRIQKLKLPYHNSFGRRDTYMEQLLWGELGDYVRQLLKGGKPWDL